MDLPNLKELKAVLKLCRAQGVNKITLSDMTIEFGDLPKTKEEIEADAATLPAAPSDEDLLYWSSQPDPLSISISEGAEQ